MDMIVHQAIANNLDVSVNGAECNEIYSFDKIFFVFEEPWQTVAVCADMKERCSFHQYSIVVFDLFNLSLLTLHPGHFSGNPEDVCKVCKTNSDFKIFG